MQSAQYTEPRQFENNQQIVYDPFQIPPNMSNQLINTILELAKLHQRAKKIGFIDFERSYDSRQLCPCCNLPFEKKLIPLLTSTKKLGFLGTGYPLFFLSTKLYILLLLLVFMVVGVYNIQTTAKLCYSGNINVLNREQTANGCYNFLGIMYTINKTDAELTIQGVLDLIAVIITCIGLYLIKYQLTLLDYKTDEDELTASDYTIIMSHISPFTSVNEIKAYFKKNFKFSQTVKHEHTVTVQEINPQIVRVIFASRIDEFVLWSKQKVALLTEQRKIFANIRTTNDLRGKEHELHRILREMAILDAKIKIYEEQIQLRGDELRCQYVFVTFGYEAEMKMILEQNKETVMEKLFLNCCGWLDHLLFESSSTFSKRFINGNRIFLERAPEPLDICWENLSVPHKEKQRRYSLSVFLSLLLIVAGAVVLYLISYLQTSVRGNANLKGFFLNYFLSLLCAMLIYLVNYLLIGLIRQTSKFEKHSTFTTEIKSATLTLIIMQFINTALIPFALFIFTRGDFQQEDLMASLFFIFLGNVFMVPAYVIFDPLYLLRLRKRRRIFEQGHLTDFTQMDAHSLFEGPDYDITDKQTIINQSILTCTFYACIFPYGAALEILALIIFYWASKYVLLRRCAWPTNLSSRLQNQIFKLMTIMPVTLAFGGFCYEYVLIQKTNNLSLHIISIIIAGIGMMIIQFVWIDTNQFVQSKKSEQKITPFSEQRLFCPVDYDRCNPVTRTRAIQEWEILWRQKEGSKVNPQVAWIPMVVNHNNQLLYGVNSPNVDQILPQARLNQVAPQEGSPQKLIIVEQTSAINNQMLYLPGNESAEFHRNNMMCSSQFVQKQMKNHYKSP